MSYSDTVLLWCLVEGEKKKFRVRISPTSLISDLKDLLKKERENALRMVDGADLDLWKVCYFYDLF